METATLSDLLRCHVGVGSDPSRVGLVLDYRGDHPPIGLFELLRQFGWLTPAPHAPPARAIDWDHPDVESGRSWSLRPYVVTGALAVPGPATPDGSATLAWLEYTLDRCGLRVAEGTVDVGSIRESRPGRAEMVLDDVETVVDPFKATPTRPLLPAPPSGALPPPPSTALSAPPTGALPPPPVGTAPSATTTTQPPAGVSSAVPSLPATVASSVAPLATAAPAAPAASAPLVPVPVPTSSIATSAAAPAPVSLVAPAPTVDVPDRVPEPLGRPAADIAEHVNAARSPQVVEQVGAQSASPLVWTATDPALHQRTVCAVVRRGVIGKVVDLIHELEIEDSAVLVPVAGYGRGGGRVTRYRGREKVEALQRIQLQVPVDPAEVELLVARLTEVARVGEKGDGKIWVT